MPNISRLGKGATRKIHNAIQDLFDKAKARFLGPQSVQGKKIWISYERPLSLPGVFEAGSTEEGVKPDLDVLDSLLRVASAYIDASAERTKARVVHEVNGALAEAKHLGGMSRSDFRDLVNTKLSEVWADVTRNVHTIVDTELAHAKNVSVLDGVVGVNLNAGIDDPVVYFVVVRDNLLCEECKRLHLLDDGKTPRLWYLSELGHGYHKKGEDNPKVGGLHPHCRCTLVTLLPGYGFTRDGMVKFVKRGHLALEEQRSLGKAEFDESKHPRDPETGEFVEVQYPSQEEVDANPESYTYSEPIPEDDDEPTVSAQEELDYYVKFLRNMIARGKMKGDPESVRQFLWAQDLLPPEPEAQRELIERVTSLFKAEPGTNLSLTAQLIQDQLQSEIDLTKRVARVEPVDNILTMYRRYKKYPHLPLALVLKYGIERLEQMDNYATPGMVAVMDEGHLADIAHSLMVSRYPADKIEKHYPLEAIKRFWAFNPHLFDELLDHKKQFEQHILSKPQVIVYPTDKPTEPHVVLARALDANVKPLANRVLASYADTTKQTLGKPPGSLRWHHRLVPLKNCWFNYDLAPEDAHSLWRRDAQDETVVSKHVERTAPHDRLTKLVERKKQPDKPKTVSPADMDLVRPPREPLRQIANLAKSEDWKSRSPLFKRRG